MDSKLTQGPGGHQGGYVLVAVAAITTVLLATGIAFMRWSTDEATQSRESVAAMQAYYLAQMGVVEKGFMYIRAQKETMLPTGTLPLPGRHVQTDPDGYYEDIEVYGMPNINQGDYWLENRRFRISAVGRVRIPFYENGVTSYKDIRRKAVLYVQIRSFADYMYLTDCEQTRLGEWIRFWHGDTLEGRVHSNTQIGIMQDPQFYDQVTQAGNWTDFEHGSAYNPTFHGPAPIFQAPEVLVPDTADALRIGAAVSGHLYPNDGQSSYRAQLRGSSVRVYRWMTGTPFDSTTATFEPVTIAGKTCMFFERPLELLGHLSGQLSIGCSENIYLVDDIWYDCTTRAAHGYTLPPSYESTCGDILGIVSEKEVKIANTYANGRNDSNLRGNNQSRTDSTDIIIMGAVVALGESFTFEQQNDPDSGYVFQYPPGTNHIDDRGQIFLLGSVTQHRRGYVHRSNNGSTGYLKQYKYDNRFRRMKPPCFFHVQDEQGRALFNITQWGQGNPDVGDTHDWKLTRYN
jgi:hypothetical protein